VAPCFPWFLSFGNLTQNSRVAGARPNHQPIGGSDLNQPGDLEPTQGGAGDSDDRHGDAAAAASKPGPVDCGAEAFLDTLRLVTLSLEARQAAAALA
jgi:hypothetical protein